MKKLLLILSGLPLVLLISCGGPPETYHKAEQLYLAQKYDSAMYYFDRLLPEVEEWYDSAKIMKEKCVSAMVKDHFWPMYSAALTTYQNDSSLINHAHDALYIELKKIVDMDSMQMLYRIIDNNKTIPSKLFMKATEYYEGKMLLGYEWESVKGMIGQKVYFTREVVDNWKGENEGNKIQAKSNQTKSGWTKNNVIYRNICYDSSGIYHLQPRIFQSGYYQNKQYFDTKGSMQITHKDTIIVNYGGAVSSNNRVWFARRDKIVEGPKS